MTKTAVAADDIPTTWPEVETHMRHRALTHEGERIGQAYFNALYEIYPEVAELVRGTPSDPFYVKDDKSKEGLNKFFEIIMPYFV